MLDPGRSISDACSAGGFGEETSERAMRERLIAAGGEVFAAHGYRDATIREICGRAGVNVAAVNYHFRDKEGLYAAVLTRAYEDAERRPAAGGMPAPGAAMPAEEALAMFVAMTLRRMFDTGRDAWHERLMAREMMEPTSALDTVVQQSIRPKKEQLESIVGGILGVGVDRAVVEDCARSVIAQVLFYHQNRAVIERLYPGLAMDGPTIERLSRHIAGFSIGGMARLAGRSADGSARRDRA